MRKIAKWRYQDSQVIDLAKQSVRTMLGEGISLSLYHCDGDYRLSIFPSTIKMDDGYVAESGFPMEGMLFLVLKKRFSKSTADKLYNALSENIVQIAQWFPDNKDSIIETIKSLKIK